LFASRVWQRIALFSNLLGAVLLFLSFQATSSNIRMLTTSDGRTAMCVQNRGTLITFPDGKIVIGESKCPDWEHSRPAAVVSIEHPLFVTIGFVLTALGFLLQFLAIPRDRPETIKNFSPLAP